MRASTRTCRRAHVVTSWRGPGRLATAILEVLGGSGPFCRFLLLPARPPRRRLLLCGLFKDARTGADSRCVLAERLAAVESRPPARSWCGGPAISGPGAGPGGGIFACAFQARELWEGSELPQVASALSRPAASDFLRRFALLPTNGTQTQSREAEKQRGVSWSCWRVGCPVLPGIRPPAAALESIGGLLPQSLDEAPAVRRSLES